MISDEKLREMAELVKKQKAEQQNTKDPNKLTILLNIAAAHKSYVNTFLHIVKQADISGKIVLAFGKQSKSMLYNRADTINADCVIIACYETLYDLVKPELGRSRKVDFDDWAGSIFWLDEDLPAIVVYPLNQIHARSWTQIAYRKYVTKITNLAAKKQRAPFAFTNITCKSQAYDALRDAENAELIAVDIETNTKYTIICVGYSMLLPDNSIRNYTVDLRTESKEFTLADRLALVKELNATNTPKVCHNGTYDNQFFLYYGLPLRRYVLDTEYLMYCMYEELPRSLAFVTGLFCPESRFWKHTNEDDLLKYNAMDCEYTLTACVNMLKDYPDYAMRKYATVFNLVAPALYCALHGIRVNKDKFQELEAKSMEVVEKLQKEFDVLCGVRPGEASLNINSPKQLQWLFYDVLGAKPVRTGGGPKRSTDVKALDKLAQQSPLIAIFVDYVKKIRRETKAVTTYFSAELRNSRLHYSYRIDGTETGRLSCKKSNFGNIGAQIQNIPKYAKDGLVADDGYLLAELDKSQAEARITAYFADDETLIDALENSEDFYRKCGELFFGIPAHEVSDELRNKVIKRIIHGTNYMMRENTFIDVVGIGELREVQKSLNMQHLPLKKFAAYLLSLYHKAYPKVSEWYRATEWQLRTKGYLESPLGWRRYFFGHLDADATLRSAVAHQPQNLNVHLVNKSFIKAFWHIVVPSHGKACLIAQVHDSILMQFEESVAEEYKDKLAKLMEDEVVTFPSGKVLRIPVDGKLGKTWAEVK